jgi:hypothetical protein
MSAGFFNYEALKKGLTGAVTVASGALTKGLEVAKDLAEGGRVCLVCVCVCGGRGRCLVGLCFQTELLLARCSLPRTSPRAQQHHCTPDPCMHARSHCPLPNTTPHTSNTDLTSFKGLKDYKLAGHVATAGPGATWRIFAATSKKPGEPVGGCRCGWVRGGLGFLVLPAAALDDACLGVSVCVPAAAACFTPYKKQAGAVFPEASVWILDKKSLMDAASR